MSLISEYINKTFPHKGAEKEIYWLLFITILAKFFCFDLIWCASSTFTPFSKADTYWDTLLVCLILLIPLFCFRAVKSTFVIFIALDLLFVSNLMYFRTYFTAIPIDSYRLIGNLSDFSSSVFDSFRIIDLFFPLSTLLVAVRIAKLSPKEKLYEDKVLLKTVLQTTGLYLLLVLAVGMFPFIWIIAHNGFMAANEHLKDAYLHTCNVPMYTLFGVLYYDYACEKDVYTDHIGKTIDSWLTQQQKYQSEANNTSTYDNFIMIIAESFESWTIGLSVEGQEITPNLNRLIKEPKTLYAPYVQTQVKGGRSIDAQLMFNCGLLPLISGTYSIKYPNNYYPSIAKAFKMRHPDAKAYCLTTDKPMVWNQAVIEPAIGYDSLLFKNNFIQEEPVGSRRQVGDRALLRQIAQKIAKREIWKTGGHTFLQCLTYSGHNPFILPEKLKQVHFSEAVPQRINDYITLANYTDHAIGDFINLLGKDKRLGKTLIMIIGDHEGLADERQILRRTALGKQIVSPNRFTPLIILNAPQGMHYNKVMGEIDIYPTLLDLLGLDDYPWKGLGRSILNKNTKGYALTQEATIIGDTAEVSPEEIDHAKKSWQIADYILRFDYLKRYYSNGKTSTPKSIRAEIN